MAHIKMTPPTPELDAIERLLAALEDNLPALDYIDEGKWYEYTGELTLSEDQWGAIRGARDNLRVALLEFTQ